MYVQKMGSLYNLYCMGWRHGSLKYLSPLQHWLLSAFYHYRKGYSEGSQWRQNCLKDSTSSHFF
jgi:hypothetical protein